MTVHVFLDFDGTISPLDVGNELFRTWGSFEPLHGQLVAGEITVAEYYNRSVHCLRPELTPEALNQWALGFHVDPGFARIVSLARDNDATVTIVSDGFDAYINPLLSKSGVTPLPPIRCNILVHEGGRYSAKFPGASESCSCYCASCKRNVVISPVAEDDVVVYVGDGLSDVCAAEHADIVFAKHTLARECTKRGIPHHHYHTLSDVHIQLQRYFENTTFRQRRRAVLARKRAFEWE